ncbi:MAG: hypothetical protein ACE5EF_03700 [Dehalococcoidia bacterium]
MRQFVTRHADKITGVLSGFDRLIFRGHLLPLCHEGGVRGFLASQGVLLKDFGRYVESTTKAIRAAAAGVLDRLGRPTRYLESSRTSKEQVARALLAEHPIRSGLICMLSAVEPCSSWRVWRSRERKHPQEVRRRSTKCLHLYTYLLDRDFGFMHVRLQTWMPYTVQVYVNGREWLGRQLDRVRMRYTRADNCFPHLANPHRAQDIFDEMLDLPWARILDRLVLRVNPALADIMNAACSTYYWTIHQSEWASDILFRDVSALSACYPHLVRHAMTDFASPDVMRFLGRKLTRAYQGEIVSDYKDRREGVRVKHVVGVNTLKMYDKAHSVPPVRGKMPAVLRIESTMNNPSDFKVRRKAQGAPASPSKPRPLRKGLADIRRRVRICQAANDRYANALALADDDTRVHEVLKPVIKPADLAGRRVRALRPWADPDLPLLRAIGRGEFLLNGFRNRDLIPLLFAEPPRSPEERRRRSARVTYLLRILRGHNLIEKVPGTHRYLVSEKGRRLIAAVIATNDSTISQLKKCA